MFGWFFGLLRRFNKPIEQEKTLAIVFASLLLIFEAVLLVAIINKVPCK